MLFSFRCTFVTRHMIITAKRTHLQLEFSNFFAKELSKNKSNDNGNANHSLPIPSMEQDATFQFCAHCVT